MYVLSGNPVAMGTSSISALRMEKSRLSCGVPGVTSCWVLSESSPGQTIMVVYPQCSPAWVGSAAPSFFPALVTKGTRIGALFLLPQTAWGPCVPHSVTLDQRAHEGCLCCVWIRTQSPRGVEEAQLLFPTGDPASSPNILNSNVSPVHQD